MRRLLAVDTETSLIRPGCIVPELVCVSVADHAQGTADVHHVRAHATRRVLDWFNDSEITTVWHNAPFDLAVLIESAESQGFGQEMLFAVIRALQSGRIRDTLIREYLLAIYHGQRQGVPKNHWTLAALADRYLGIKLEKEDTWRLRYWDLVGVPVPHWPEDARKYALLDAAITLKTYLAQQEAAKALNYTADEDGLVDEVRQNRAAFCLHVMSAYGMRTEAERVFALAREQQAAVEAAKPVLEATGIIRTAGPKPGSRNMAVLRAAVEEAYAKVELEVPLTDGGKTATDAETLRRVASVNPTLKAVTDQVHAQKILSTFCVAAFAGVNRPINARLNPLMASGRTSCSGPNLQNLPKARGVRQCFIPRDGFVFSSEDYSVLEMRTLAQTCLDWNIPSRLAEAFRAGRDPHAEMGARLARTDYATFVSWKGTETNGSQYKRFRNFAKVANFGLPGGLGADTFVIYAASQPEPVIITRAEAKAIKQEFLSTWAEMGFYFERINAAMVGGFARIVQPRSFRVRGGCRYTAGCNSPFQGLASDIFKDALWRLTVECLIAKPGDVLYKTRPVMGVHDELLCEHPREIAGPAATRVAQVMKEVAEEWTPDVPHIVEPTLMNRWDKEAKPIFDDDGNLVPFDAE